MFKFKIIETGVVMSVKVGTEVDAELDAFEFAKPYLEEYPQENDYYVVSMDDFENRVVDLARTIATDLNRFGVIDFIPWRTNVQEAA